MAIERKDLVDAVLASRDEIDPDLETAFLSAIVDAEGESAGDGAAAIRAIDAAVSAAIERGVGWTGESELSTDEDVGNENEEDQA